MGFILLKIPAENLRQIRQLSTTDGFVDAFQQNIATSKTFVEAYEITEAAHEEVFGKRKYSCYQSFATNRVKRKR